MRFYEHRSSPPLSRKRFLGRLMLHFGMSAGLGMLVLFAGMAGFHSFEGMQWIDAFLEASMLLSGMGPTAVPVTEAGKLFAGGYALFSGIFFLIAAGLIVAPMFHRLLHLFHGRSDSPAGQERVP